MTKEQLDIEEGKLEWTLIFIHEFGKNYGLDIKTAFDYLLRYDAIKFIERNYSYVHTQSFASMVSDIADYCRLNGGNL